MSKGRLLNKRVTVVIHADRVDARRVSGFTLRQARLLVLVLEHSGVCLPRQYRTFAGVAHGRHTHAFFEERIAALSDARDA